MSEARYTTRLDETVSFEVPTNSDAWHAYFANPGQDSGDAMVDSDLLSGIREVVSDIEVRGRPADVGRGASGYGAALDVLLTIGGVGGGLTTLWRAGAITRAAYRAVRRRLGHRPNVSLGAATFLAAADLTDRLGHCNFQLLGSGDTNSTPPDSSFTGDDTFWAIFSQLPDLYIYIIAANGRVHYLGSHEIRAGWGSRLGYFPGSDGRLAQPEIEDDDGDSYDSYTEGDENIGRQQ